MKIEHGMIFSVERGTDEECRKTLEIFEKNGVKWRSGQKATEFNPDRTNIHLEPEGYLMQCYSKLARHYTASEFHAKFGDVYPFALEGDPIEYEGKWWRKVSREKAWAVDEGIPCLACDSGDIEETQKENLLVIFPKSLENDYPMITSQNVYCYAWVEVPAPESKSITLEEAIKLLADQGIKIKIEVSK